MGPRRAALALLAACSCLLAACATTEMPRGASPSTTAASTTSSSSSSGLTVTLTAAPSSTTPGSAVVFLLSAHESDALGAFGYHIAYGDGATDENPVPQWCRAAPGQPASQTWRLVHSYAKPGTYTVTASVAVNCTTDRGSATVTVTVSSA
ncbi:MAG TPA: hypothetical protein VEG62_07165 [Acidimicrobiales bacterium]|nr:hypothetical protein [Acidimicrobiales bacterium]